MAIKHLPLFSRHPRSWRTNCYVYPVISRRSRGLSIGINLNPDKVCNFDCVYCCVKRDQPARAGRVNLEVLAVELDYMLSLASNGEIFNQPPLNQTPPELRRLNDIAFSGDGEPTTCRGFADACQIAVDLLAKYKLTDVKVVVITNATCLERPTVVKGLAILDRHHGEIWGKLDAGTEAYYRAIDRSKVPLQKVLDNLLAAGRVRPIVIQSLFMKLRGVAPEDAEVGAYLDRLRQLVASGCQIGLVQVYTVARHTAEAYVSPLDDAGLDEIAGRVRALGLAVEVGYAAT
jgi:wyosine [tRNA(Phe)-imidazoG37] synthetase (radical SAM superfamily)